MIGLERDSLYRGPLLLSLHRRAPMVGFWGGIIVLKKHFLVSHYSNSVACLCTHIHVCWISCRKDLNCFFFILFVV